MQCYFHYLLIFQHLPTNKNKMFQSLLQLYFWSLCATELIFFWLNKEITFRTKSPYKYVVKQHVHRNKEMTVYKIISNVLLILFSELSTERGSLFFPPLHSDTFTALLLFLEQYIVLLWECFQQSASLLFTGCT